MIIIGIDPGKKGAIAFSRSGIPTGAIFMPEDLMDIYRVIKDCREDDETHVFIEKAQSMPGQGVSSMFSYGKHYGEILGVLRCLGVPHTEVPPRTWTKVMHAGTKAGKPKSRSLEAVRKLFPTVNLLATARCKKPHDGIVDSLLIAEYGRRQLNGYSSGS